MTTSEAILDVPTAAAIRQEALDSLPALYKTQHERLAYELALNLAPPEEVFGRYGLDRDQAVALLSTPGFAKLLDRVTKDVEQNGLSFKAKARAQAEELLTESFSIATDPLQSGAVRADLIKWTARVAGYEPKGGDDDKKGAGGGGLTLNIQFAGTPAQTVVSSPLTIEADNHG